MESKYDEKLFAGKDPLTIFRRWLEEARLTEINDPDAIALATVDEKGLPNVRMVLLRIIEEDGFVFFTNYGSNKAKEAFHSNKVAFNLHWKSLRRQIRVRGYAEKENGIIADKYFSERQMGSKIAAWASKQSQTLLDREKLIERWQTYQNEFKESVRRPDFWGGIRIKPIQIEFWADGQYRLHDRFVWERQIGEKVWDVRRLFP
ncbi:MAG: pyridoxamine 5'-phosphate oxidase [Rhodobacteraceae bacterium]|nr:pyridoxamine 5'-phosphate oxidase [Paracoccaceae bacterium]